MSLPVIVTRTLPGADDTVAALQRLGYRPVLSPMLRLVETGFDAASLRGVRHIVFTSANGVRAVRGAPTRGLTAWCVGPSTAEAARGAGFASVIESDGNADDLARLIVAARPVGGLLHIANQAAAGDLVAALRTGGLDAAFSAPYRTEDAPSLCLEALAALDAPCPAVLLLHSAKAAHAVAASHPPLANAAVVAISAPAAAPLTGKAGKGEWLAARPNEASLIDALSRSAASLCP